jgi:hypothetical protein
LNSSLNDAMEVQLSLRLMPARAGRPWRVMLVGPEPQERVSFESMRDLVQYLQALSEPGSRRGLR